MTYDALRRGRVSIPGGAYHVVLTTEGRLPLFSDFSLARMLVREMRQVEEAGLLASLAWVVMPDHLHWLFVLGDGQELGALMGHFKGRTAHAINAVCKTTGKVWQRGYYDHAVRQEEALPDIARYIVANPLRSRLVARIGDYPFWDVVWL